MTWKELFDTDFRGAIYIVQGEEVLYQSATGYADLANWPMKCQTRWKPNLPLLLPEKCSWPLPYCS